MADLLIPERSFRWPTLSDLNDKMDDELWESDPDAQRWRAAEMLDEVVPTFPIETAPGPPPAAPTIGIPAIPSSDSLNAAMILSDDRLFFVSIPIGTNDVWEWRLVQLLFEQSVDLSPSCMQTGKFLVDFYISHPADWCCNAVNQRFWLQYFKESDVLHPDQASETHLIRPSPSSAAYAIRHHLVPAQNYVHLLHEDTFIHGPFDFAKVNNRKTSDRISEKDWQVLARFSQLFQNPLPSFDVPTYLVHVDNGVHAVFIGNYHNAMLIPPIPLPRDDTSDSGSDLFSEAEP